MLDKVLRGLKQGMLKVLKKTAKMKITGLSLLLIRTIIMLVIIAILLYLGGWLYKLWYQNIVDLLAMNELIKTLTGVNFIAAIGFFGKALLDEDDDGESDYCENDLKKEDNNGGRLS